MTPEEFKNLGEAHRKKREKFDHVINVCTAAACVSLQSEKVKDELTKQVKEQGKKDTCRVSGTGCLGLCASGPLVTVNKDQALYGGVKPEDASDIVKNIEKKPVKRLQIPTDMPFFARQTKIALEHCGKTDPEVLNDYLALEGYEALFNCLTTMEPIEVIDTMVKSGLRGRGDGGYPV
ncbi:MAG: NAD(P)H-dependent oxidoreductase subunit E, partial [Bacteroidota bacterium]